MLPLKLVRSLVLRETMSNPFLHNHGIQQDDDAHDADDEEEEEDDDTQSSKQKKKMMMIMKNKRRKTPLLLFTPTRELISDTFRLASIARDIGMDFHPTPSLSHLIFSWPPSSSSLSSSSSLPSSTSSPFSPSSSSTSTSSSPILNDAVPLPFPSLSTPSVSLSLLRYFVSLSKGLFQLVFLRSDPDSETHPRFKFFDDSETLFLFSRVSAKRVESMDGFSRELAGFGWTLFRTRQIPKSESSSSSSVDLVYLFRKKELNRVRGRGRGPGSGGSEGECRVRELRLPALDFKNRVTLRVLLYILLMTDDIFYLA